MTAPKHDMRSLAVGDLDRVIAIDQSITGRSRRGFYAKRFASLAESPQNMVGLAAEGGGKVMGFLFADVLDGEFGGKAPVGVLGAIGVDRAMARRGVASSLAAALEGLLADRGVRELRTEADWMDHDLTAFLSRAGYRLSRRLVLERPVGDLVEEPASAGSEEFTWEQVPVRSMTEADLPAIVQTDRKITGRDRTPYYQRKAAEVLRQSGVRVSLVAEVDRQFAGFLMARVDLGEFGRTEPIAVIDTLGVHPAFGGKSVGRALLRQLLLNLGSLRVERVVTQVEWDHFGLLQFLSRTGFDRSQRLSFEKPIL
jgi:ribosomal protein S18 acetylase RimI-like enzyme